MLHSNVVMKVTNTKKGIFSIYSHNMNKNISMRANFITVDLKFLLKVLIINKVRIHIINISNCTLYVVKFFIEFDTLLLVDFCRFSK